jgi:hypothetical protein
MRAAPARQRRDTNATGERQRRDTNATGGRQVGVRIAPVAHHVRGGGEG